MRGTGAWDDAMIKARGQAEPEDAGGAAVASHEGRPDDRRDGHDEGQRGGHSDEDVHWATRPVGDQGDTAAEGPKDRQGHGK